MPRSPSSWNASASCRLEWRPSRLLGAMLAIIGLLAVCAVLASGLPGWAIALLAPCAAAQTILSLRRYLRLPRRRLVIPAGEGAPTLEGVVLTGCEVQWRGPLAFLAWRDAAGRHGHLAWWPDTLDTRARRELRLAAEGLAVSARGAAMAP
ncbi:hypothetical protein [Pseudoxanthomonas sp. X-1]|uniref:Toxin CptA n=2 Tax=Pseudoxanthomonas winnipegensis TaxID=2480810 RepID=A0A4V2HCS1_9GAMM|nr:hypothetical protein [Pseudoxanthomonas sp. X-1]TAA23713.1 hypothetical protein EA660_13875 [Pseudoxanthomonas winnipegensis]TMN17916.1 hypothetical protein FF950_16130 [Pseudoxanthomonas sp. X-1]UAY76470.1 hypothetical protein LAJ50_09695 [Pseudoxanthomonas sp. X-1]